MKNVNYIVIHTKSYYPWEVTELQSLIADGLRSLKCNSIRDETLIVSTECKDCEYKHLCKTLHKIYIQLNDITIERGYKTNLYICKNFF